MVTSVIRHNQDEWVTDSAKLDPEGQLFNISGMVSWTDHPRNIKESHWLLRKLWALKGTARTTELWDNHKITRAHQVVLHRGVDVQSAVHQGLDDVPALELDGGHQRGIFGPLRTVLVPDFGQQLSRRGLVLNEGFEPLKSCAHFEIYKETRVLTIPLEVLGST